MVGGVRQFTFEHKTLDGFPHQRVVVLGKPQRSVNPLRLNRLVLRMVDEIEDLLC